MKYRYIFTKDYSACPTGYAQTTCKTEQKKLFKKGDVVWGEKYMNAGSQDADNNFIQGWALAVDSNNETWDIPLPPLDNSPVSEYPIVTFKNILILIFIIAIIWGILKLTKVIK